MILAIDIGNTNEVVGVHNAGKWQQMWRMETLSKETVFYYQMKLSHYFDEERKDASAFDAILHEVALEFPAICSYPQTRRLL